MDMLEGLRKRELKHTKPHKASPWKRGRNEWHCSRSRFVKAKMNAIDEPFDKYKYVNMDLDIATKRAALRASSSVVGLSSRRREGGETLFNASGTIYESCEDDDGRYVSNILTSASLFGSVDDKDVEIKVYIAGGRVFDGNIVGYDVNYNLAIISIASDMRLSTAKFRLLDDSVSMDPTPVPSSQNNVVLQPCSSQNKVVLRPRSRYFKICAGQMVVALGRDCKNSDIMAAPGKFSVDECGYDCMELLMATCIITKPGVGGPLVNCHGEVIGVNFMNENFTPFLAVNIVSKWLNYFKRCNKFCRPWTGVAIATNIYAIDIIKLECLVLNNHKVSTGVRVEAILSGSPAHRAGLLPGDVIIQCNGRPVTGFLKLCRTMLDKSGKNVEVGVIRKGCDGLLKFIIVVEECPPDEKNSWPLPKELTMIIETGR